MMIFLLYVQFTRSGPIPWVFSCYSVLFDISVSKLTIKCYVFNSASLVVFSFCFFNFSFDEELVFIRRYN